MPTFAHLSPLDHYTSRCRTIWYYFYQVIFRNLILFPKISLILGGPPSYYADYADYADYGPDDDNYYIMPLDLDEEPIATVRPPVTDKPPVATVRPPTNNTDGDDDDDFDGG